jgi:hypothetical protein
MIQNFMIANKSYMLVKVLLIYKKFRSIRFFYDVYNG